MDELCSVEKPPSREGRREGGRARGRKGGREGGREGRTRVEGHPSLRQHAPRSSHRLAIWAHGEVGWLLLLLLHPHRGRGGVKWRVLHGRDHAPLLLLLLEGDGEHLAALGSDLRERHIHGLAHKHFIVHLLDRR